MRMTKADIKRNDILFQQNICDRDYECVLRGEGCMVIPINAHHIIKRRYMKTRHNLKNGVGLCPVCHDWCHSNPEESEKLLVDIMIKSCIIKSWDEWYNLVISANKGKV